MNPKPLSLPGFWGVRRGSVKMSDRFQNRLDAGFFPS